MSQDTPQNLDHLNETMLYKCPGPHEIHGGRFDYVIVPEVDIPEAQAQGWHLTTTEAKAAHDQAQADAHQAVMQKMEDEDRATRTPAPVDTTTHLLATQANAEHLETSIEQANASQAQPRELVDTSTPAPAVTLTAEEQTAPATYDEMKTKAKQLGLEFQGNISKAALLAMITAKLAEQA